MFHHFHGGRHPEQQGSLSAEELETLLRFVDPKRILHPMEWMDKVDRGQLETGDLCLTFDDALLSQFEIALPVLARHRLRAFWFVYSCVFEGQVGKMELYRFFRCTAFEDMDAFYELFFRRIFASKWADEARAVLDPQALAQYQAWFPFYSINDIKFRFIRDRALHRADYEHLMDALIRDSGWNAEEALTRLWMSNEHLTLLSRDGHLVGLHSYSHPTVLGGLPREAQVEEYERNAAHLTGVCGRAPVVMAHPANSYSDDTINILGKLGIRCGFRSNMAPPREGGTVNPNALELAREDHANVRRMVEGQT